MKIGVCVGDNIENMLIAKKIGYDYVETNAGDLVKADEELFVKMKNVGIPILTSNCFIGMRVVGPERDFDAMEKYVDKLFSRASELGLKIMVFGSSGARKRRDEEGLTADECREQVADFLKKFVAPRAEKYNIRVAIEPLRPAECNIINTISDGVEIAKKVGSPNIKVLCDLRHMYVQDEPMSEIEKYADWLIHCHTSNPEGDEKHDRTFPKAKDNFNQDDFLIPCINAGMEMCSIEAGVTDFETDAREAFEVLKKYR